MILLVPAFETYVIVVHSYQFSELKLQTYDFVGHMIRNLRFSQPLIPYFRIWNFNENWKTHKNIFKMELIWKPSLLETQIWKINFILNFG